MIVGRIDGCNIIVGFSSDLFEVKWYVEEMVELTQILEDIAVTEQLVAAGQHLDIELVDHLVIGNQRFVSLKERLRW